MYFFCFLSVCCFYSGRSLGRRYSPLLRRRHQHLAGFALPTTHPLFTGSAQPRLQRPPFLLSLSSRRCFEGDSGSLRRTHRRSTTTTDHGSSLSRPPLTRTTTQARRFRLITLFVNYAQHTTLPGTLRLSISRLPAYVQHHLQSPSPIRHLGRLRNLSLRSRPTILDISDHLGEVALLRPPLSETAATLSSY